jgi:outer membrane protein assembly factor BamA
MKKANLILCLFLLFSCGPAEAHSQQLRPQEFSEGGWSKGRLDKLEGLTVRFIYFTGNATTSDYVTRRKLLLTEGDTFKLILLRRSLSRINKLGLFERVTEQDVEWHVDTENRIVDFNLLLKEKPRRKK